MEHRRLDRCGGHFDSCLLLPIYNKIILYTERKEGVMAAITDPSACALTRLLASGIAHSTSQFVVIF